MSRSNHSRPKKRHYREYHHDRVDDPIEGTKKPLKEKVERYNHRIRKKSVEYNLRESLDENKKQPDHEKVLNKLIHCV